MDVNSDPQSRSTKESVDNFSTSKDNSEINAFIPNICTSDKSLNYLIDNSNELIYKDAYVFKPSENELPQGFENKREATKTPEGTASGQDELKYQSRPPITIKGIPNEKEFQGRMNTRPLPAHAKTYQMEKFERNAMIIFNFVNIDGFVPREGTIQDENALRKTFSKFHFEIEPEHKDLTKVELFKVLDDFSQKDFTDYGCVVIVVLTHGTDYGLLRAKDQGQLFSEQNIINQFKTPRKPTLLTKPVILIIQACRGTSSTKGMAVMEKMIISKDHDAEVKPYVLPVEADMLVFHSSYAGKPSYRPENGSWFIQTLCKQIEALYLTDDLESIFIEVKREVAIDKYYMEWIADERVINKQMPVVTSTLIRKLYLRGYGDKPPKMRPCFKIPGGVPSTSANPTEDLYSDACYCFMDHFGYMKTCLSHIVQSYPGDSVAKSLLEMAKFESGVNDDKAKTTLILISNYLQQHYKKSDYHKYIYFYDSGCSTDIEEIGGSGRNSILQRVTKKWGEWSRDNVIRSLGTCVGAYMVYSFISRLR